MTTVEADLIIVTVQPFRTPVFSCGTHPLN